MKMLRAGALALSLLGAISTSHGAVPEKSCLPQRTGDLAQILKSQPIAKKGMPSSPMVPVTRGSPRWMAAFNAILAWENDECVAFSAFAEKMGYEAFELRDPASGHKSWVLLESGPPGASRRYNGFFALRAPAEASKARRLIVSAPLGASGSDDGRAAQLYQKLNATALLVSTAERCSIETCSGCAAVPGYACHGCSRASDTAHAVDNLLFGMFAALEATRTHNGAQPYLHFEMQRRTLPPLTATAAASCSSLATMSEGPIAPRTAAAFDEKSYPARFFTSLSKRLGRKCVCYHQRERGCSLEEPQSVLGRLVNQESPGPFDPCTQEATRLSGRHVHFEWQNLPIETVVGALAEAVPQ